MEDTQYSDKQNGKRKLVESDSSDDEYELVESDSSDDEYKLVDSDSSDDEGDDSSGHSGPITIKDQMLDSGKKFDYDSLSNNKLPPYVIDIDAMLNSHKKTKVTEVTRMENVDTYIHEDNTDLNCESSKANAGSDSDDDLSIENDDASESYDVNFKDTQCVEDEMDIPESSTYQTLHNSQINQEESTDADESTFLVDTWTPEVPESIRPKMGEHFESMKAADDMYRKYAFEAGFDVRQGPTKKNRFKIVLTNYLLCNRQGKPNTGPVDTMNIQHKKVTRRCDTHRTVCRAFIMFRIIPGTCNYYVDKFSEQHNHPLISKDHIHMSRASRQLDPSQQSFIFNMAKQNIGATKAYRIMRGSQGGYTKRGGLATDFKNCARDLNCFIGARDAHMLVNKMLNRKNNVPKFAFEFRTLNGVLDAMFWADETAKYHYNIFGDVVSFDATFNTNRYNMVFVPFTGIDNHKRCVTFGAGLLSREDTDSYVWLLKAFLKTFVKQPTLILSDEDAAMKKAIKQVLPLSQHRLCMWHITSKIGTKLSWDLANDSDFITRFNHLIWNSKLEEQDFETGWELMLEEFKLKDNKWLKKMYGLRRSWIPAFFKYIPMAGLMRTTSLSECQNSTFTNTTLTGSYLINFMTTFESSMEKQRHDQSVFDFRTSNGSPKTITYLPYEPHAVKIYTRKVFYQVQEEIFQSEKSCFQKNVSTSDNIDILTILEKKHSISTRNKSPTEDPKNLEEYHYNLIYRDTEYQVTHDRNVGSFQCSCMHFEHVGLLCRHIFCALKYFGYESIPEKYILKRWCRDVVPTELIRMRFINSDLDVNSDRTILEIFDAVNKCVAELHDEQPKMEEFLAGLKDLTSKFVTESIQMKKADKKSQYERMLGVTAPDVVVIQNPANIKNKGCGSRGKRLKNKSEMLSVESEKPKRKCGFCKQMAHHDKRNCPHQKTKE